MSSLRQLAKQLDISPATVSAALRGMPNVKRETRERVLLLAKQKGYNHNPLASSVMGAMRRSHFGVFRGTIGIVRPHALGAGSAAGRRCADLIAGARKRADASGYRIDELSIGQDAHGIARLPEIVAARGFAGLLVVPPVSPNLSPVLSSLKTPVIYGDLPDDETACESIGPDYHQGISLALSRIKAKGFLNPGLILDSDLSEAVQRRCRAACAEFFMRERLPWTEPFMSRVTNDISAAKAWLSSARHDALLCTEPEFAASVFPSMRDQIFTIGPDDAHEGLNLRMEDIGGHALDILTRKVISTVATDASFFLRTLVACTWHRKPDVTR